MTPHLPNRIQSKFLIRAIKFSIFWIQPDSPTVSPEQPPNHDLPVNCSMHSQGWFTLHSLVLPALSASNASSFPAPQLSTFWLCSSHITATTKPLLTKHTIPQQFWPTELAADSSGPTAICICFQYDPCNKCYL